MNPSIRAVIPPGGADDCSSFSVEAARDAGSELTQRDTVAGFT
jgi:hypothetical protein